MSVALEDRLEKVRKAIEAYKAEMAGGAQFSRDELAVLKRVEQKLHQACQRHEAKKKEMATAEGGPPPAPDAASGPPGGAGAPTAAGPGAEEAGGEPEKPAPVKPLSGSVGRGGKNQKDDVTSVQQLLNAAGAKLTVDGLCGPKTIGAISAFQKKTFGQADGRVDPGARTWQALGGGGAPDAGEAETPAQPGQPGAGGEAGGGGSGAGGGTPDPNAHQRWTCRPGSAPARRWPR